MKGKNTFKRKTKKILRKTFFTLSFFLLFLGLIGGIQSNPTNLNSFNVGADFPPEILDILPKASIGPTIENLTKTDPLEIGEYANVTVDINHTANGVDTVLIEIGPVNYTMSFVSGNEYSYTWQPSAVGNVPFTIYANATTIGDWNSLSDSIDIEDTTAPSLSIPVEPNGDPVEFNGAIDIRVDVTDLSTLSTVWIDFDGTNYTMSLFGGDTYQYTATPAVGTYSYTIYANDTYNNVGNTLLYDITVDDTTGPSFSIPVEPNGDPVEFNGAIDIRVDVTDLSTLSTVWIDFDGTNYTMSLFGGDTYQYTATPAVGTYSFTIYANDTYNNVDNTLSYDITVEDTTAPTLSIPIEVSGDPVEFNGAIDIRVDVTDLSTLSTVWIDFDGTNYTMSLFGGDTYQYTATPAVGTYSFTIYANDTYNNVDNTLSYDITVEDTTAPTLSIPIEVSGDPVEFNGAIDIRVDVTDLSTLSTVWIDFDGTNYTMSLFGGDTYQYTATPAVGTYSFTIYANDTYNNVDNTLSYDITVEDTTAPTLSIPIEVSGDPVEFNGAIDIRVDVTDLSTLSTVWIDFDGTNYTMSLFGGDTYRYTATPAVGTYSFTIYANDTYNNVDNTLSYDITVEDTTAPTLSIPIEVSGDPVEFNGAIDIRVDVTDLSTLSTVWIDFDGTNYTMSLFGGDTYRYTATPAVGTYSFTIYANDTYNNVDNTLSYDITVEDTTAPTLSIPIEVSGDPVEFNGAIDIRVDVTDLSTLSTVWIDFDGTNYTMSLFGGDTYRYTATPAVGTYSFTIYANDTYNNVDNTLSYDITVEDTTAPTLSIPIEVSGDPTQSGENVTITVDINDLSTIDEVLIEFNGINYTMDLQNGNTYNFSRLYTNGVYSYSIYANDTYGNENSATGFTIEVSDIAPPVLLNIVEVSEDPTEFDGDIYIRVNASHSLGIDSVWIEFDGTNHSMIFLSGDMYYYTGTYGINTYSYTIYANSTIGIEGSSGPYTITVSDNTGPTLSNLVEVSGDPVEYDGSIYLRVNVTDLSIIDDVWVDFGGTNHSMTYISGDMYYYTTSPAVGLHSYTIYANDTYGNEDMIAGSITVQDTTAPSLSNLVEVSGDPVSYNGTISIRINVTDLSSLDSIWIEFDGTTNYSMNLLSGNMFNYSGIHSVGLHSYSIYANDTYDNVRTISGDITVSEYVQSMIIFNLLDYPTSNLTADTNFTIILPIDDNSTLDWAKVYFLLETGLQTAAPGDDWTPITLVNGSATISSEYFDAGETLSYYFEIKDTYGVTFYVSSSGISTSNSTAQLDPFSFQITAVPPPPFDLMKWLPYIIGGIVALAASVFIYVGVRRAASKREYRDFPELKEAGDTVKLLLEQQKSIQKEAIRAEKDKDYYTAVAQYQKLIVIANELFKFGSPGARDNIKSYKAKIIKYEEKSQKTAKPGSKQALQQEAAEYQKMAEEAERTNDFGTALVIYHQVVLLREKLRDKSQISATKGKIKDVITEIPNIRELSAKILAEAEEKYKAEDFVGAHTDYCYLKTIFDALGDKNLISYINKLISDASKHL